MKKISYLPIMFIVICLCFIRTVAADTGAQNSNVMTVFDDVVHLLAYTLSVTLMGLLTLAVNKLRQKWHLDVPQAWLDKVHSYIDLGIAYAEEQAHKWVADDVAFSSEAKLNTALGFVLKFLGDDKRLVALGEAKIKQLIEARLNQTRTDALPLSAASSLTEVAPTTRAPAAVHSVISTGAESVVLMSDGTVKPLTVSK